MALFISVKRPFFNIKYLLLLCAFFLYMGSDILSQTPVNFNASLIIELENKEKIKGGILYENDLVSGVISFDEKWDGKSFYYCYVFHYTDQSTELGLAYPGSENEFRNNKFPQFKNGIIEKRVTLFEGVITAPFGKDNFVLVMTEQPISNLASFHSETRDNRSSTQKQELLKLIKGSKLSEFYHPENGAIKIATLQFETRPIGEKDGLAEKAGIKNKSVFALSDSSEMFYTPRPQADIVRDSFPTIEVLDPAFDTTIMRGAKVLANASGKKIMVRGIAVDWKRGIKRISVNNQPVTTYRESSGYFDYMYDLKEGENIADVAVENNKGYKRVIRLKFQHASKENKKDKEGKDHLLVIGINEYKDWPRLHNASKDAKDFKKIMVDEYGFKKDQVHELFDEEATRKKIYARLRSYVDELDENDRLLIYFSGHGFYDKSLDMGYWIPVDAHSGADDEYLDNLDITRMLQKMKAKSIFVIADACYSGQLLRDMQKDNSGNYKSRMVLCSGKLEPVPDGQPGTNSPFAKQVLEFLNRSAVNQLLASELIHYVKKSFTGTAGQKPVGGAIDEVGDENGDFIFRRKK